MNDLSWSFNLKFKWIHWLWLVELTGTGSELDVLSDSASNAAEDEAAQQLVATSAAAAAAAAVTATAAAAATSASSNNSKNRRRRTAFSTHQLMELEREFQAKKYLSLTERSQIAQQLRLSEVQIKIWFQNRRAKWKRVKAAMVTGGHGTRTSSTSQPLGPLQHNHQSQQSQQNQQSHQKLVVPIPVHVNRNFVIP